MQHKLLNPPESVLVVFLIDQKEGKMIAEMFHTFKNCDACSCLSSARNFGAGTEPGADAKIRKFGHGDSDTKSCGPVAINLAPKCPTRSFHVLGLVCPDLLCPGITEFVLAF